MTTPKRTVVGWVMYDFANTIFSMNIVTFFFAPWVVLTLGVEDIYYSIAYSASMILVALTMPALGRRADRGGSKLTNLRRFTYLCVLFTVVLSLVAISHFNLLLTVVLALTCFACANFFYEGGLTFYNALLADVSSGDNIGRISGIGVGFGYLGAIAGLLIVMPITEGKLIPGFSGREYAFFPTAILFLLLAIPTFLWVREKPTQKQGQIIPESFLSGWKQALRETRNYPGVLRFLIADYLIEDAIATLVIFMAIYAEAVAGFTDPDKVILFISSTLFAFGGSLLFGWFADKFNGKRALLAAVIGWVVVLSAAVCIYNKTDFFVIGALVGILLGAVWTTSRPLLNSLVPKEKLGQFYGLYTLSGRAAATIGPLLWGLVALVSKQEKPIGRFALDCLDAVGIEITPALAGTIHYRLALASLLVTMVVGLLILVKVPGRRTYEE
ncbi:MAG: MFS transporter [candidate division Zixibacteria bacterium]|nr:MFS transporter [candidate division Zixibacteria bacterium]